MEISEIREMIMEIKYRDHDPKAGPCCETCRVCDELLQKLSDKVANKNT